MQHLFLWMQKTMEEEKEERKDRKGGGGEISICT